MTNITRVVHDVHRDVVPWSNAANRVVTFSKHCNEATQPTTFLNQLDLNGSTLKVKSVILDIGRFKGSVVKYSMNSLTMKSLSIQR